MSKTLTIDASLLATCKSNTRQMKALHLSLCVFTDKMAGQSDIAKERAQKAVVRIGGDVLKRKNALEAKSPAQLRQYVETIKQRTNALLIALPSSTWLLDFCSRATVANECRTTLDMCSLFVAEYEAGFNDGERKAHAESQAKLAKEKEENAKNATLDAQANASLMVKKAS
jgi:hypothetical protein